MRTKVPAARIATNAGMPVVLTSAANAAAALHGDSVALCSTRRVGVDQPDCCGRHGSETQGQIVLDDGAVRALTVKKASLLPAGITGS